MADTLINLAVTGPHQNFFTYKVRPADTTALSPGCRFLVPFGRVFKTGFFIDFQRLPVTHRLRYVKERIDYISPFPGHLLELCRWMADYYYAGLGETLAAALPGAAQSRPALEFVAVDQPALRAVASADKAAFYLAGLFLKKGSLRESALRGDPAAMTPIHRWIDAGIIAPRTLIKGERKRISGYRSSGDTSLVGALSPGAIYTLDQLAAQFDLSPYKVRSLCAKNLLEKVYDESGVTEVSAYPIRRELPHLPLLDGQHKALDRLLPAIDHQRFEPFLLFGVTGSGKTLVYCHAARQAVNAGGSVLVMVPEIALSGILLSSLAAFFGDQVVVIHSGLTARQRESVRQKIASGRIKVVIGPRSAIFSPLPDLRLIIVDEEHDPAYKQDDPAPRYHARDAAVMLARTCSCPVVLGSASPSIESYHNAVTGRYTLLTLDQRPISGYTMPQIVTLDMKHEKIDGECSFLSYRLKSETEKHIAAGGQVIWYLNRRGFAPRIKCRDCGHTPVCPDCGITLTYHRDGHQLKCHFCDRVDHAPAVCAQCGAADFIYLGAGTQRVEENLSRLFDGITAQRIDSDRTASKSGRLILSDFAADKFDLLVGTQMVTKGLDIPNVTLVGVLSADIGLEMPDFRAAEKTYARLLQVAGRAGRGEREGVVLIQTYNPEKPVMRHLTDGDYIQFFDEVIADRRELSYPPFMRLINITLSCADEKLLEKESLAFRTRLDSRLSGIAGKGESDPGQDPAKQTNSPDHETAFRPLPREAGCDLPLSEPAIQQNRPEYKTGHRLLGPAPAPLYKLRKLYRRRLIIKCAGVKKVVARFRQWETEEKSYGLHPQIKITFDIDPVNMM